MSTQNVYPKELRQILAYVEALDAADAKLINEGPVPLTVGLRIEVTDEDGTVLGRIVDEIGGAWFFQASEYLS